LISKPQLLLCQAHAKKIADGATVLSLSKIWFHDSWVYSGESVFEYKCGQWSTITDQFSTWKVRNCVKLNKGTTVVCNHKFKFFWIDL